MKSIFNDGGEKMSFKAVSVDLPFALKIGLKSKTLCDAAKFFIDSIVMPYV